MSTSPQTTIILCGNVPLDNTYRNTMTFNTPYEQTAYFLSKKVYEYDNELYQRRETNVIRISSHAAYIQNCNYMMFQNSIGTQSEGLKWFYAFITKVQYINNEMTEITWELDIMQTYKFDYTTLPCFVEREHVNDDTIGKHLVPENLEIGDYVMGTINKAGMCDDACIIVAATFDKNYQAAAGNVYGKTYSGLCFNTFNLYDIAGVNAFIQGATSDQKSAGIVSIFISPPIPADINSFYPKAFEKTYGDFDGYTPKNNKLYCYPYNFLYAYTDEGAENAYHYEYFSDLTCRFNLYPSASCSPDITAIPVNYKGNSLNLNEKLTLSGFPQCAYAIDSYKAWLAQNGTAMMIQGGMRSANIASAVMSANPSEVVNGIGQIAQDLNTINVASRMPDSAKGSATGGSTSTFGLKDFYFCNMHIRGEFAQIIDNYFNCYGYKVNSVKTPNVTGRQSWNFVKTINSNIVGNIPADALANIRSIFDKGITFWHTSDVGNYTLSNNIV